MAGCNEYGRAGGVTLTPSGDLIVTQAGAVISGLDIKGTVIIKAANVTIENCKITSASWFVVDIKGVTGTVIQNCEINGVGSTSGSVGINGQGTFIGNNIYNVENGINLTGSAVIKDNYIHDLNASGSPHYDGIQIDGGVSNVTISDNTVIAPSGGVSAIMIDNYWGPISNTSVSNNLLAGGGFTVYSADAFSGGPVTGVSFTNNHMASGQYGYTSFYTTNPTYSAMSMTARHCWRNLTPRQTLALEVERPLRLPPAHPSLRPGRPTPGRRVMASPATIQSR
jgi:parallel beta helix pectate lyase-like protein